MGDIRYLEPSDRPLDRMAVINMENCAAFLARMIEKYGQEVLEEIEKEETSQEEIKK